MITGGNTGLGYETARRLKEMGHDVTIACRNEKKARNASAELGVKYWICDVTDDNSVSHCAGQFAKQEGYLDVLINNAGIPGGYTGVAGYPNQCRGPGSTKTGENFPYGAQTVTEGTDAIVRLATIGKDGPTGTFMNRDGRIPW